MSLKKFFELNTIVLKYFATLFIRTQPLSTFGILLLEFLYFYMNFTFLKAITNLDNEDLRIYKIDRNTS